MRVIEMCGEELTRVACHYEKVALRAAVFVWRVGRTWDDGGRFIAGDCGAHPWAPPLRATPLGISSIAEGESRFGRVATRSS